jgi:hypothetical protein
MKDKTISNEIEYYQGCPLCGEEPSHCNHHHPDYKCHKCKPTPDKKPSERIKEIANQLKREYSKSDIIVDYSSPLFNLEAIIKYLDEQYEK